MSDEGTASDRASPRPATMPSLTLREVAFIAPAACSRSPLVQQRLGGVKTWTSLVGSNHAVAAPPAAMIRVRPFSRIAMP
jgi:hypothetical protein